MLLVKLRLREVATALMDNWLLASRTLIVLVDWKAANVIPL